MGRCPVWGNRAVFAVTISAKKSNSRCCEASPPAMSRDSSQESPRAQSIATPNILRLHFGWRLIPSTPANSPPRFGSVSMRTFGECAASVQCFGSKLLKLDVKPSLARLPRVVASPTMRAGCRRPGPRPERRAIPKSPQATRDRNRVASPRLDLRAV